MRLDAARQSQAIAEASLIVEDDEAPAVLPMPNRADRPAAESARAPVDDRLVSAAREQIDVLAAEIADLAGSDCSLADFCRGLLDRILTALAAQGGAVWTIDGAGSPQIAYQVNLANAAVDQDGEDASLAPHRSLVAAAARSNQPQVVPPHAALAGGDVRNDSQSLVLLGPVFVDGRVHLVVEVVQRAGGGAVTQRGYVRFLVGMCRFAAEYLRRHRLREFSDRDSLWQQLEQFLGELHQGLDVRRTVYTIANDGRRILGCDRVSVAVCRGRRCRIEAVSGLDSFDRRAQEVKRLGRLARSVLLSGEPLWHAGDSSGLPPQIEAVLHAYVDRSHARRVAVIPLFRAGDQALAPGKRRWRAIGALVVEQLADGEDPPDLRQRTELVARHAAAALANALDHNSVLLLPLWKALGRMRWVMEARNLPKLLLAAGLLIGLVAALCVVPRDFDVAADGKLRPQVRREVFAGIDGVVVDVPVEHLQSVREGDVVARLRNTELEVEIESLLGQKTATRERILSVQRALLDTRLSPQDQNRANGELATLKETADSIERMLTLVREKEQSLTITAPTTGQIATWKVRDLLLRRPVQSGQSLMKVIDPAGEWELELEVPERRMKHIAEAALDGGEPLQVTFVLATHPELRLTGRVVRVDQTAEVRENSVNSVLVRVAVDKHALPDLRDGAKVTARIHCDVRPLGYVIFHDLIETAQVKVLFWF
jgi:multidrug resistance efflux pump